MLITFDRGLLELNGVNFWRLCFFDVSVADIRFSDLKNFRKKKIIIKEIPLKIYFYFFIGEKKIKIKGNPIINFFLFFIVEINMAKYWKFFYKLIFIINWVSNKGKSIYKLNLAENIKNYGKSIFLKKSISF